MQFKLPLFPEQASSVAVQVDAFYLFLVLIVRIVGRRPGKQLTPF